MQQNQHKLREFLLKNEITVYTIIPHKKSNLSW